jgi:hypothetical protein
MFTGYVTAHSLASGSSDKFVKRSDSGDDFSWSYVNRAFKSTSSVFRASIQSLSMATEQGQH